ncbi:MAG: N-acetylglucosaminyldiphosphoundecaprenol [Microgenomates group bacterium Gr01-1014_16]|nr:MAG: N-acetylglucosaminyldiphosphoundecaprenol [Microgenomates group bacterium Gr01-1014_16]
MEKNGAETVDILGIEVASSRMDEVLSTIMSNVQYLMFNRPIFRPFFVVTVNPEFVVMAQEDKEFKEILNRADLAIADGVGLKLAGIKEIVPGRMLVEELLKMKLRTFYLGGINGVSEAMAKKYGGEFDEGERDEVNPQIINKINSYKPDLLLVAYGAPWQEKWIYRHLSEIKAKVVIGVGGAFDYLTGKAKVPPDWINEIGMEWLWRLFHEPWRWRRQLRLVKFAWLMAIK